MRRIAELDIAESQCKSIPVDQGKFNFKLHYPFPIFRFSLLRFIFVGKRTYSFMNTCKRLAAMLYYRS